MVSHHADTPSAKESNSGRYNESSLATSEDYELRNPFAEGAFRWVAKGRYVSGPRKGQQCVAKWFKTGAVFSSDYFTLDIKAVDKALELVNRFNQLNIINKVIKINVPAVWTFTDDSDEDWAGQKVLCEPFINNYQKFNSNSGWNDDALPWGKVMQALSHFSYHVSGGFYVLYDLQGGIIDMKLSFLTLSSYPGAASMVLLILALMASARSSASMNATTFVARTGPSQLTQSNISAQCLVPL